MGDLNNFITFTLHNYVHSSVPFIEKAFNIVTSNPQDVLERLVLLDNECNAMQNMNHVSKRASEAQGIAYLSLMCKSFDENPSISLLKKFKLKVRSEETRGHHAICFGMTCAAMGLSIEMTRRISLFILVKSILSAAVRLNIIGPYKYGFL